MNEDLRKISERIRELREIFGLTEEEMARDTGVDVAKYIEYETNGENIPISVLYHISHVFGVDMSEILTGEPARISTLQICRRGKGKTIDRYSGYMYEDLAPRFTGKVMEPLLVTLVPGEPHAALVTHGGQEFNLVLEGSIALVYDDKEYILNAGDAVYFDPTHPHGQKAAGEDKARFLTVITEYIIVHDA
ncbi:MAG: cupin domain-containing protein [Oscillospiraceae bacterium]|jgi:transcriptional regulator with XRE-family HTH domain|nr:cupin domain-containing protein [Oscillospiraceae bacterium]